MREKAGDSKITGMTSDLRMSGIIAPTTGSVTFIAIHSPEILTMGTKSPLLRHPARGLLLKKATLAKSYPTTIEPVKITTRRLPMQTTTMMIWIGKKRRYSGIRRLIPARFLSRNPFQMNGLTKSIQA